MDSSCVLLAEPHHGLAEGTRLLLVTRFETVVMVADEGSLCETAGRLCPAVVVADLRLAKKNVAALVSRLKGLSPRTKVILLGVHDDRTIVQAVADAAADGFVAKGRLGSELVLAVEAVLRGERYFAPGTAGSPADSG